MFFDSRMEQWYPSEHTPISHCDFCGTDLFEGEELVRDLSTGQVFCDTHCFKNSLLKSSNYVMETLERKI